MTDDTSGLARGRDRVRIALWVGAALVLFGVALLLFGQRRGQQDSVATESTTDASGTVHATTLFFGARDGRRLVPEQRDLVCASGLDQWCEAAIRALVDGPREGDAVRTLPVGTMLHRVFYDENAATVYLDFAPSFVTRHPGGTAAEWATLGCIVKTIGANFPAIARVQFLVDQQPVESLAGHFDLSVPVEVATWP
jgi:spore germination protein GerM